MRDIFQLDVHASFEEQLKSEFEFHRLRSIQLEKSLKDYQNGDYTYVMFYGPAYCDFECKLTPIEVDKTVSKEELHKKCYKQFMLEYKDTRKYAMVWEHWIKFKNGYSIKIDSRETLSELAYGKDGEDWD